MEHTKYILYFFFLYFFSVCVILNDVTKTIVIFNRINFKHYNRSIYRSLTTVVKGREIDREKDSFLCRSAKSWWCTIKAPVRKCISTIRNFESDEKWRSYRILGGVISEILIQFVHKNGLSSMPQKNHVRFSSSATQFTGNAQVSIRNPISHQFFRIIVVIIVVIPV